MKRSTAYLLLLGVCFVVGMDIYATMSQVGGHNSLGMWLMVQQQTPTLWAIDGIAIYAILLTMSYTGQVRRAEARRAQVEMLQVEHQAQMEPMLTNMAKADDINAAQEAQLTAQAENLAARDAMIAAQEETIRSLAAQTAALQQEVVALQAATNTQEGAFVGEAQWLLEQAFRALSGQVDAQTHQLEAVNLALQYHQAEIQRLRAGRHMVSAEWEPMPMAQLAPAEQQAISAQADESCELFPDAQSADAAIPTPADIPPPVIDAAPDGAMPDVTLPDATPPIQDDLTSVPNEPILPSPVAENGPNNVIMEPIYFRFVPVEEEAPTISSDETALAAEIEVADVLADALTSAIPPPEPESKVFNEAHAVVASSLEAEAATEVAASQSIDGNLPFPHSLPALRLTRWQRKL